MKNMDPLVPGSIPATGLRREKAAAAVAAAQAAAAAAGGTTNGNAPWILSPNV